MVCIFIEDIEAEELKTRLTAQLTKEETHLDMVIELCYARMKVIQKAREAREKRAVNDANAKDKDYGTHGPLLDGDPEGFRGSDY